MLQLRRYERISVQNRRFRSNVPVDPKFHIEGVAPPPTIFSQKTRLNDFSYGIKIWTDLSSVLSQCTRLTYRRTDGRTDRRRDRILIPRPRLHYELSAQKNARLLYPVQRATVDLSLFVTGVALLLSYMRHTVKCLFYAPSHPCRIYCVYFIIRQLAVVKFGQRIEGLI